MDADGLSGNTIVFLWSDHGEGLPRAKRWPYDAGIRVPLLIRWPGYIEPGTVSDRLVSLVDLAPTVLSLAGVDIPLHMHGRPFMGERSEPREYVFAARDRYDESYDMVRAVRDNRYKYIRNYYPGLPYLLWIPYHNQHPVVQEMWRLHAEQRLEGRMRLLMGNRPAVELYDTSSDPFEMKNLAEDPACWDTLIRMRLALDDWRQTYDDQGEMSEEEMVRRMRPEGSQPRTAAPLFVPICPSSPGIEAAPQGGSYRGPLLLQLFCATQGASIVYTTDAGSNIRWRLYTGPLRLSAGMTTVRARASRSGYAHSEEISAVFILEGHAWLEAME